MGGGCTKDLSGRKFGGEEGTKEKKRRQVI